MEPIAHAMNGLSLGETAPSTHVRFCSVNFGKRFQNIVTNKDDYHKQLRNIRLMYVVGQLALKKIEHCDFESFDALVSECACHLRALKVCKILNNPTLRLACLASKSALEEGINQIDRELADSKARFKKAKLADIIAMKNLDVEVPKELVFLTQVHLLTLTKSVREHMVFCKECHQPVDSTHEVSDSTSLEKFEPELTRAFRDNLVKNVKVQVAQESVAFIQEEAKALAPLITRMLGPENSLELEGRQEAPCAYSLTHVVTLAACSYIPILLKVQKCQHFCEDLQPEYDTEVLFVPQKQGDVVRYLQAKALIDPYKPIIVLEGRRAGKKVYVEPTDEYQHRLAKFSFEELVEMNAVQHAQYTQGKHKLKDIPLIAQARAGTANEFVEEAKRLRFIKQKAKSVGCSHDNPSLLVLSHMFVGTLAKQSICHGATRSTSAGATNASA